jgi:3-hydroxyacyl-[acyl-carrier-protein] dehydratase
MPGVLLLEAMAQTSGWLIIGLTQFTRMPFLAAFRNAKLRSFVTPGQTLGLHASILHEGSGYTVTKAEIKVDGKVVSNAEISFRVVAFPTPDFRAAMERVASTIAFPMEALANG